MNVGRKYKIESDALNIMVSLKKTTKKTKKEYWISIAYFSSVKNALKYMVDLEVNETGLKELKEVARKQEELYRLIEGLKTPQETLRAT